MNFGIAELWSLALDDARRHLEEALALARRIGRPYLEIGCLGHLALAAVVSGAPVSVGLQLSEEAVAIAEEHGWATNRIVAPAFAAGAAALAWLGRFDEAERGWSGWSARGRGGELETEPVAPPRARLRAARAGPVRGGAGGVPRRGDGAAAARARARAPGGAARRGSCRRRCCWARRRRRGRRSPASTATSATGAGDAPRRRRVALGTACPQEAVDMLAPMIAVEPVVDASARCSTCAGPPCSAAPRRRRARRARRCAGAPRRRSSARSSWPSRTG